MPSRKGSQKVRTGCRTCKLRKVKCDESRPSCIRCLASRRTCLGYECEPRPLNGSSTSGDYLPLSWYRPRQLAARDPGEARAFSFFTRVAGPALSWQSATSCDGPSPSSPGYFWTRLVLQFSHFEPTIRHAVLAIAALYEDFRGGARIRRTGHGNAFAVGHYNAAVRGVREVVEEEAAVAAEKNGGMGRQKLVLVACVLFVCVEYLRGDFEAALVHCRHGIAILNETEGRYAWAREYLVPIFQRLSTVPLFFGDKIGGGFPELTGFNAPVPDNFDSVLQAQEALNSLLARVIRSVKPGHASQRLDIELALHEWHCKAAELELILPLEAVRERFEMCNMQIMHEVARIRLHMASETTESAYDRHIGSFQAIIHLARQASELQASFLAGSEDSRPCFTFDLGFLCALFFVVTKCRFLKNRLEALSCMARLSIAKEGLFDLGTLYRVARRVIEIEHGISLNGEVEVGSKLADTALPAEGQRVIGVPINHDLEAVAEEDGTTTYRRNIWFLFRGSDGNVFPRHEHLTDRGLGDVVLGVPAMRSALSC